MCIICWLFRQAEAHTTLYILGKAPVAALILTDAGSRRLGVIVIIKTPHMKSCRTSCSKWFQYMKTTPRWTSILPLLLPWKELTFSSLGQTVLLLMSRIWSIIECPELTCGLDFPSPMIYYNQKTGGNSWKYSMGFLSVYIFKWNFMISDFLFAAMSL